MVFKRLFEMLPLSKLTEENEYKRVNRSIEEETKSVKKDIEEFHEKQRTNELGKILNSIKKAVKKNKTHIHIYHRLFENTIESLEKQGLNVKIHPLLPGYEISWRLETGKNDDRLWN